MLNYKLTMSPIINRDVCMPINNIEVDYTAYKMSLDSLYADSDIVNRFNDSISIKITSVPDIVSQMSVGMGVGVAHSYTQDGGVQGQPTTWEKMDYLIVRAINKTDNTFSFQIPFFVRLDVDRAFKMIDETGVWGDAGQTYLLLYFSETHLFSSQDSKSKGSDDILNLRITVGETVETLDWDDAFYNGNSRLLIPWLDDYDVMIPDSLNDGRLTTPLDVTYLKIERSNPDFGTNDSYKIFKDIVMGTLPVPISNKETAEGNKEILLSERFVDDVRKKTINPHIDMERDVYHPVWYKKSNKAEMIYDIIFNFHFRQHRGDDWLVDDDSMWNGTYKGSDGKWNMMNSSSSNSNAFFSNSEPSRQSDLLSYLGFNNNDVRYQKSRLTKSFVRLLFYDSPNTSKQNLLYTSTVYLNSNELFGKYVRYAETIPYSHVDLDGDVALNLSGIDVGREPYNVAKDVDSDSLRLSSRIHLKDKLSSDGSSDGFYLYLWKDYDFGTEAQDLYLKIEFNHAGYGRTIPFMMPFFDKYKHNAETGRIKSFEDILRDFSGIGDDSPYGIRQYQKYSYIHLKYKYDNVLDRHVFYLDPDTYGFPEEGSSLAYKSNMLYINLYEAKLVTDGLRSER